MLKSLLSLLLSKFYSKKESSLVAHQAMPNFENAVALSLTTGNDGTYVAPADGYINVEVESSGYVNFWGGILDSASNGLWNKVAVPVSKGRTVRYHIEGQVVYAAFINLVGGGQALKNALLQGGGLCLNSLSSSLRRSSWLENRNGLQVGGISQSAVKLLSRSQTAWTFKHTRLQQTVSYLSDKTLRATDTLKSMLVAHGLTLTKAKQRLTTKGFVFRLSREERLPSRLMGKTEEITLSWNFLRSLVNLNSAVGGASC